MATVTEPIVLDKSINTTEQTPRNIADVLAEELKGIADSITTAENIENILTDMATTKTAPTISGTAVFDTVDGNLVKSLKVAITPSQDLHGYDHPWAGGAGKNLLNPSLLSFQSSGYVWTNNYSTIGTIPVSPSTNYVLSFKEGLGDGRIYQFDSDGNQVGTTISFNSTAISFSTESNCAKMSFRFKIFDNVLPTVDTSEPMLELGSTATSYEPYENICPISGHTQEVISVKDSTDTTQATYTTSFGQTVYGGTLDVLSGELTITHGYIASYNGETLPSTWISDRDEYVSGGTPTTGAEVVYELATPTTIQLTPQTVKTLVGENHISASTGDVLECKYSMLINGDDLAQLLA